MKSRSSESSVCSKNSINSRTLSPFSGSDGGGVVATNTTDSTGVCRSASPSKTTANTESNSDNGLENKDCCEDNQNIPPGCIVCAWCAKVGTKLFTLLTVTGYKSFCSELCFTQCRRASFKKNKNCDWCKHVRPAVNYVDFQDGEQHLKFCSNKCLNQYKMNIFCNETKAHLHLNPRLNKESSKVTTISNLITPELWLKDLKNGDNEYNSVNSFKDSSDSDLDLELEDSPQAMVSHQNKRKFSEFSKDVNELKPNKRQKDIPIKEKSNKETKRIKHSNKSSNSTSRQTSGGKHSKHSELVQQNDCSSRESSDKTSSFHSPSFRPNLPSVPSLRASMLAPKHNIPIFNSSPAVNPSIRATAPLNSMPPNASSPAQLFPRLVMPRGEPLMPSPPYRPRMPAMPNLGAQMEMFARMQSSFPNLRLPFTPFGPQHNGFPFTDLPNINGIPNGTPLLQPSIQGSGSVPQLYPNSLLPPMTIMVPFPVPIPIPIPIPVPIIFPVDKESISKNKSENINNQTNISSTNEVTTSTHNGSTPMSSVNTSAITTSKIESVISKLVERKTRANSHQNTVDKSSDFRRMLKEDNNNDISGNDSESDNSSESLPQNLVVNKDKRSIDLSIGLGYR